MGGGDHVTTSSLQGVLSWLAESQERCKDVPAPSPWGMRLWDVEKGTVQMSLRVSRRHHTGP